MTAAVRVFLELASKLAPDPWRESARVALTEYLADVTDSLSLNDVSHLPSDDRWSSTGRISEAAPGGRGCSALPSEAPGSRRLGPTTGHVDVRAAARLSMTPGAIRMRARRAERRAHACADSSLSLDLHFSESREDGEPEREPDPPSSPETGVFVVGEDVGADANGRPCLTSAAQRGPDDCVILTLGETPGPAPGMVPVPVPCPPALEGQPRTSLTPLPPRAGPIESAATFSDADRAFGVKLGLSPLEAEAAWRDWREFRAAHPKSKQTLTQCLVHFARKNRERTPVQLELPPARAPDPPRDPSLRCELHGRDPCRCPPWRLHPLVRAREGPGLAQHRPEAQPVTEAAV